MFGFKRKYSEEELIAQCKKGKRDAQQELYSKYSDKMLALCIRYVGNQFEAEDVLVVAFMKIFEKIDQYSGQGNFEGWIRRIMVNESLMYLRKQKHTKYHEDLETAERETATELSDSHLEAEDLMKLIQALPDGYRIVFNLYAIEGFSHKEIAAQLEISEGTSKSQLSKARNMLKRMIEKQQKMTDKTLLLL
ncbi:MAG: RNA polymerase sigma factor [Flammeovirgaceae bacterium]